jgi:hypothetical protein
MKFAGLIMIVIGWLLAVSGLATGNVAGQIVLALLGFLVSLVGIMGVLNRAHLASAIWKQ